MRLVFLALFLGACGGGDDFRNGHQDEAYIDPGPSEISAALASSYADPASPSRTMRGVRVERVGMGDWVAVERVLEDGSSVRSVYRADYAEQGYLAEVYRLRDGVSIDTEAGWIALEDADLVARPGCTMSFERTGPGEYVGSTEGTSCPASSPDASHTAIDVVLEDGQASVWEREVDLEGEWAAGASEPDVYSWVAGWRRSMRP